LVLVGALLIHILGKKLFLWRYDVQSGAYLNNFFSVDELLTHPLNAFAETFNAVKIGFGITGDLHLGAKLGQQLFALVMGALILFGIFKSKLRLILLILFGLWVFVVPYALTLANAGHALPWRTHIEMPFVYAGLLLFALNISSRLPSPIFYLVMFLGVWVNFQFYVVDNRMTGSANLSLTSDRLFAARLLEQIDEQLATHPNAKYLAVIGSHYNDFATPLKPKFEGIGSSFFELEGGDPVRMIAFLNTIELLKLSPVPPSKAVAVSELSASFGSVWPASKSVWNYEDVIVVRFGEYTPEQIQFLCGNGSKIASCNR
jgi:hypothetical protein